MIGALSQACSLPVTTAVTCPTTRIHPAVIAQAAATAAVQLEGRFVLGRRHRRGAERARARRPLAVGRRPSRDARGGRRADARELWTGDVVTIAGHPLRRRHRPDLHAARRAAAGLRLGVRPEGARPGRADRRRVHQHRRRRRGRRVVQGEVRREALPGRREGRLGGHRGRRRRPRAPALGQRRAARRAGAGAAEPAALRAGLAAGHPRVDGREHRRRQRRRAARRSSSATTSTPATTRCTSPTWARTTWP